MQDPKPPRLATPHSCGNSCSRSRVCGHPCPLPCHPGPCPPCLITIQNPCHCEKDIIALVCSRANPTTGGNVTLPASRSCGQTCGKALSCGNHFCQDVCHDGKCPPCQVTDLSRCWCGKERKELACGEGENKECAILTADGEESWIGRFGCENTCERSVSLFFDILCHLNPSSRPLECGIHKCAKRCHPPSRVAPTCPYSPLTVTHCPCGKHSLSDPSTDSHFGSNAKLIRTSCTDPVPTCMSLCEKPLEGCTHSCRTTCHIGPCPPCAVPLVRPCRCGATTHSVICSASQAETETAAFLCNRPCGALRSCGHHQCTRLCCPFANLANPTSSKSKKKAVGTNVGMEFIDTEGWHLCDVICGKLLSCGNHRCEERDHRGSCPPCFRSSFEEV
jgi:transcriptional repressor NF-X1